MANESLVIYSMNKVGRMIPSSNKMILRDISLGFYYGAKIGVLGLNGAGKSTLLKILAGVVPFQQGERDLGHNAKIGYFSQHRADTLDDIPSHACKQDILFFFLCLIPKLF